MRKDPASQSGLFNSRLYSPVGGAAPDFAAHAIRRFLLAGGNVASTNSGEDGKEVTVNLTGVANAQPITVTLFGVKNTTTNGNVSVSMGVLVGDVNANKAVTNTDVVAVKV